MRRTHRSLYYLAAYLIGAGIALAVAPAITLSLLFSNGSYGDVMPRLLGTVLFALGVFVAQTVRLRLEPLYATTLAVRVVILLVIASLYAYTSDPLFLVLLGVVGFGFVFTGISYVLDRRDRAA